MHNAAMKEVDELQGATTRKEYFAKKPDCTRAYHLVASAA
jgi:hypothetical protein